MLLINDRTNLKIEVSPFQSNFLVHTGLQSRMQPEQCFDARRSVEIRLIIRSFPQLHNSLRSY